MKLLVTDELWAVVEPLLPKRRVSREGGPPGWMTAPCSRNPVRAAERHPVADAPAQDGLRVGGDLLTPPPRVAAPGRLEAAASGVARAARGRRPDRLEPGGAGLAEPPGEKGGRAVGRNPTDKGNTPAGYPGSKQHVVVDRTGIPLAVQVTAANLHHWLARYRRLTIRYERLVAMHRAFLHLGCALICWNYLMRL